MQLAQVLDFAIKQHEAPTAQNKFFELNGKKYLTYIDNDSWRNFVTQMKDNYPSAYAAFSAGSGDELGLKKSTIPPKMACFGSSSRMIFNLSKDIKDFCFEYKLPTKVGGIAHLDGYLKRDSTAIYVEAKCHEPYSEKSYIETKRHEPYSKKLYIVSRKYEHLYRYLNDNLADFACEIDIIDDNKMQVKFFANNRQLMQFDLKQMICHLLAIATKNLTSPALEQTKFVYLLFNPKLVEIDPTFSTEIISIYEREIEECKNVSFKDLYKSILTYLYEYKKIGNSSQKIVTDIKNIFSFSLCDQTNYLAEF